MTVLVWYWQGFLFTQILEYSPIKILKVLNIYKLKDDFCIYWCEFHMPLIHMRTRSKYPVTKFYQQKPWLTSDHRYPCFKYNGLEAVYSQAVIWISRDMVMFFHSFCCISLYLFVFLLLAQSNMYSMAFSRGPWFQKQVTLWSEIWFSWLYPAWGIILTHWGRDKMAAVSQTTLSNAFSWMKMLELRLKFHWSLFLRVQLTKFPHCFR